MFFKDKVNCSIKSMASINIDFNDTSMLSLAMLNCDSAIYLTTVIDAFG